MQHYFLLLQYMQDFLPNHEPIVELVQPWDVQNPEPNELVFEGKTRSSVKSGLGGYLFQTVRDGDFGVPGEQPGRG